MATLKGRIENSTEKIKEIKGSLASLVGLPNTATFKEIEEGIPKLPAPINTVGSKYPNSQEMKQTNMGYIGNDTMGRVIWVPGNLDNTDYPYVHLHTWKNGVEKEVDLTSDFTKEGHTKYSNPLIVLVPCGGINDDGNEYFSIIGHYKNTSVTGTNLVYGMILYKVGEGGSIIKMDEWWGLDTFPDAKAFDHNCVITRYGLHFFTVTSIYLYVAQRPIKGGKLSPIKGVQTNVGMGNRIGFSILKDGELVIFILEVPTNNLRRYIFVPVSTIALGVPLPVHTIRSLHISNIQGEAHPIEKQFNTEGGTVFCLYTSGEYTGGTTTGYYGRSYFSIALNNPHNNPNDDPKYNPVVVWETYTSFLPIQAGMGKDGYALNMVNKTPVGGSCFNGIWFSRGNKSDADFDILKP